MVDVKSLLNLILGAGQNPGAGQNAGPQSGGLASTVSNMLGELQNKAEQAGGIGGVIGSVLNQAREGLQQGATDLNKATGVGDQLSEMSDKGDRRSLHQ
jgi:hypothetical protein